MAGSIARKKKEQNWKQNVDLTNPVIIQATIDNLKLSFRGNNPEEDEALQKAIDALKELKKHATGGNKRTEPRPKSTRPWRK